MKQRQMLWLVESSLVCRNNDDDKGNGDDGIFSNNQFSIKRDPSGTACHAAGRLTLGMARLIEN
jgi:hypothetical protein